MKQADGTSQVANRDAWRRWSGLVYLLFFLSGLTSLVYEVIWVRKFGLVFGVSTYAVSTVLAAFFSGLAIGSYLAGRIIDRTRLHPLAVYGGMEGIVGAYALLLPLLLRLAEASYPSVYSAIGESFSLFTLFRFLICFVLLVLPTTLMGATLPVLSKLMVDREAVLGLSVGRLYAINTFGAVTGSASAGFLLIPALGVPSTTLVAAIGNFALAAAALLLARLPAFRAAPSAGPVEAARPSAPVGRSERIILMLAFTAGLCALALEVVWTRSLVLILGSTTYAFTTMLTAVLVGIALGSAVFSRYADQLENRAALVAGLLFTGGLCASLGPAIVNWLPSIYLRLTDWAGGVWWLVIAAQFVVCFMLVFVPTFLSGASFPILVRMYSRGAERVGRTVADVYAVNTVGGILGSLIGGFVLVKFLGLVPALTIAALLLMLVGGPLAMALAKPWPRGVRAGTAGVMAAAVVALGFAHPRFETKLLFGSWGPFAGGYYASRMGGTILDVTERYMQRLLYHREGVSASVDVFETGWGERVISVNAQPVATTYLYDMRALKMLGHLPVLLHPDPKEVLLIGLGAGVSSGIMAGYSSVEKVTVVELSEEVPGGTRKFADWNHDVLDNRKVKLIINDGANYVKATRKQYDVISSDPIHPFIAGNGILYSSEHWRICKDRLRPGGVLAQWLPLYQVSPTDFATIIRTFLGVFPDATMWFCGIDGVLIGTNGGLRIDLNRMGKHMSTPVVAGDLLSMGVQRPADVLGWYVAGPDQLDAMGGDAPVNRVERPVLEFTAPKAIRLQLVASTMPALLAAVEQLPEQEAWQQLQAMCTHRLDPGTLRAASQARETGRWLMRGQLLASYEYGSQYLDTARQAYALRPGDVFIQEVLSDALTAAGNEQDADGDTTQAYAFFRDAFTYDPSNAAALTGAIYAALENSDLLLAEQTLALAGPEEREVLQVLIYSGVLALWRRDYEAARGYFERARRRRQEAPLMWVGLGIVALHDRDTRRAQADFRRALETATSGLDALYNIVDMCRFHGFSSEAREYAADLVTAATAAIAADPARPALYEYRALGYRAQGEDRNAERDEAAARGLTGWWEEPQQSASPQAVPEVTLPPVNIGAR